MPINPVQFAHSVCDEFLRYLFSAFPLADPDLRSQFQELLNRPSSLDIPLARGPFISLSESFAKGKPVLSLAEQGILHHAMPALIGYPTMYQHQQEVFEAVKAGEHVLVATGTGSGKTESFLYPIVDDLLRQRDQGTDAGITAILVYPMNALANDQLDRLRDVLGGTGITFGQWVGTTPENESEVRIERFNGSSRQAFLAERKKRREEATKEDRAVHPIAPLEECCSEEDIKKRRPRILLTNYRQLEILTTRLPDVAMFADAPLKYLVFDEAHTYAGATGAEVACLIRRLRMLAGKGPEEVICVGTSATLSDPTKKDGDKEETARRFASRFFGVDAQKVKLVGESYVSREWPTRRYKPMAPRNDGMERLGRILAAVTEPVNVSTIKSVVEELTGQIYEPGPNWQESLFDHLISNEYIYQTTEILKHPKRLNDAAWQTSQRLASGRLPEGNEANSELLCYLVLGAAARKEGDSLLRPKVHFFIRGLDEAVVTFENQIDRVSPRFFLSIAEGKQRFPGRHDDAFFPVLTCKCGQHFFEKWYQNLEVAKGQNNRPKDFENGNSVSNPDGSENAWWATSPIESGTRIVMTNRLLEEADGSTSVQALNWPKAWICRQCGAIHRSESDQCHADGCGHTEALVQLTIFGESLSRCPSCGSTAAQIGGRILEPARKIQASTVADIHILSQGMINAAPEGHQKLIIFADSRQDAAFQAGWMQDHARRIRLRHMIHDIIASSDGPLPLDEIVVNLLAKFKKETGLVEALLPELSTEEAPTVFNYTNHTKWVPVRKALRYMVLREFTTALRRMDCLESMGLCSVIYEGLSSTNRSVRDLAETVGISPDELIDGISLILDMWRRNRILHVSDDPVYSRYHAKDDPFIQAGLLPLRDFKPEGVTLRASSQNEGYARGLIAQRGASAVQAIFRKWTSQPQSLDVDAATEMLWRLLTEDLEILSRVTINNRNDRPLARDVWQINLDKFLIEKSQHKEKCKTCQRVMARQAPKSACTRHNCQGQTVSEPPDIRNYDVWMMGRPFTMVSAEEHTAQVPGETRNKIENDFKSKNGRTNCLVATPTLEMGVNIGALDMALMRNVPPKAANYWQRAGRAGREERMAVVVTYCRRSPHDRYFFDDPLRILGGVIEAPAFNLQNPLMLAKHIHSAILSDLLLRSRSEDPRSQEIRDLLKEVFPTFIRSYLLENDQFRDRPTSTAQLDVLLQSYKNQLLDRLDNLFAKHWPTDAAELARRQAIEGVLTDTANELGAVLTRLHRRLAWARKTRSELYEKKNVGLIEKEEEQLLKRCDDYISSIVKSDRSTYTLTVLANEGFLPGYGVYEGGIVASARRGFGRYAGPKAFELSRSNVVALREFVPGNRLYANRGSFYVNRYHLGAGEDTQVSQLMVNVQSGYISETSSDASYGQSGSKPIESIPITDMDLMHESRITEDENLRFSMPVSVIGRILKRNRGGKAYKIGDQEVSYLRGQEIELVNIGESGKVKSGELGHWICSVCGATKSPYVVPAEINSFLTVHQDRCGKEVKRIALSTRANVDMLQFHSVEDEPTGINIGESIRTAATRILDMGPDDLQLLIVKKTEQHTDLLIYDPMIGGSGLLDQIITRWTEVIATAKHLLRGCALNCESACYSCLKTFRNQFYHGMLDRHKAIDLMDDLDQGPDFYREILPVVEDAQSTEGAPSNSPEARLLKILQDHHFPNGVCRKRITTSQNVNTEPDWLHEPSKVAVYLDGMSRGLHGDPKTAKRDQIIRFALEIDEYNVIVIQRRDLDDPVALRQHLKNIAIGISRPDLIE